MALREDIPAGTERRHRQPPGNPSLGAGESPFPQLSSTGCLLVSEEVETGDAGAFFSALCPPAIAAAGISVGAEGAGAYELSTTGLALTSELLAVGFASVPDSGAGLVAAGGAVSTWPLVSAAAVVVPGDAGVSLAAVTGAVVEESATGCFLASALSPVAFASAVDGGAGSASVPEAATVACAAGDAGVSAGGALAGAGGVSATVPVPASGVAELVVASGAGDPVSAVPAGAGADAPPAAATTVSAGAAGGRRFAAFLACWAR